MTLVAHMSRKVDRYTWMLVRSWNPKSDGTPSDSESEVRFATQGRSHRKQPGPVSESKNHDLNHDFSESKNRKQPTAKLGSSDRRPDSESQAVGLRVATGEPKSHI